MIIPLTQLLRKPRLVFRHFIDRKYTHFSQMLQIFRAISLFSKKNIIPIIPCFYQITQNESFEKNPFFANDLWQQVKERRNEDIR